LTTLTDIELESGFAEMLKHGLIADAAYWKELQTIDPKVIPAGLLATIYRSVEIKRLIVMADHLEEGLRKNLNFGHTIGHAIEGFCLSQNAAIPHGYAVAWGMIAESDLALQKGLISQSVFDEINVSIRERYPKLDFSTSDIEQIKPLLLNDKKNVNGEISFTLLTGIGQAIYDQKVTAEQIDAALRLIIKP
jgi:3-dehydroquinate synthase